MALLGTASFLTIAGTVAAQAQGTEAVEEVLVTGSLIRGAAAVGVPVTALSDQDFKETGALTVADLLKDVPSVTVSSSLSVTNSGGNSTRAQQTAIHNLSKGTGTETLMMINGMRYPLQGTNSAFTDPSIVPQLAVDHIDVLADGASATYGSDAVAGVINVIMKHGFEGAISQVRYARSWDLNGSNYNAAQLYGTKWNSGDITLSYEWYHEDVVRGPARNYFTSNFEPYGFDDRTAIGDSMPGVITTGAPAANPLLAAQGLSATTGTRACVNCYSIPAGAGWNYGDTPAHTNPLDPGSTPTTTWTALLANQGVKNLRNPSLDADILPTSDRNAATVAFDQTITNDLYGIVKNVSLFVEGFYSNRQTPQFYEVGNQPDATQAVLAIVVPSTNPYYPAGAPAGLRVSYNLGPEHDARDEFGEIARRYDFGFNADLPSDWRGHLYYSMSEDGSTQHVSNVVNTNMVSAALGNTVPAVAANRTIPGQLAFTKPANIPYLNLFCDATQYQCNSPITLAYLGGYRNYEELWKLSETGINLDGPIVDLPGGTVRAALGANAISTHFFYNQHDNLATANTSVPNALYEAYSRQSWAVFGQLNVPLVGEANKIPLVEAFDVEGAVRYDRYYNYGGVTTPKLAATWDVGYGLSLRGTIGRSFRQPDFIEQSNIQAALFLPFNGGIQAAGTLLLNCPIVPGQPNSATAANANTLNAYLNPTCSNAVNLVAPVGVSVSGSAGAASALRTGPLLGPEKAKNWAVGFNFRPMEFLTGLNVDVTYYHIKIDDVIAGNVLGVNANDPANKVCTAAGVGCAYFVRANPNLPITDPANAVFFALASSVVFNPRGTFPSASLPDVQFVQDSANTNLGYRQVEGLDFNARYDIDLGDWGAWNTGVIGNFRVQDKSQANSTVPVVDTFVGNSGGRLRYRARLGWTGMDGLSVTGFVNFIPHGTAGSAGVPPKCYWSSSINPATGAAYKAGDCYPGSPFIGPYSVFPQMSPGLYTFDLSLAYQTGTKPANAYLQNINFQLTVNDLFNKAPPFSYVLASQSVAGNIAANIDAIPPEQRYVSFAITKAW